MLLKTMLKSGNVRDAINIYQLRRFIRTKETRFRALPQDAESVIPNRTSRREMSLIPEESIENICGARVKQTLISIVCVNDWHLASDQKTRKQKQGKYLTMPWQQARLLSLQIVHSAAGPERSQHTMMIIPSHYRLNGCVMSVIQTIRAWVWRYEFKEYLRQGSEDNGRIHTPIQ